MKTLTMMALAGVAYQFQLSSLFGGESPIELTQLESSTDLLSKDDQVSDDGKPVAVQDSLLERAESFDPKDIDQVLKDHKVVLFTLSYCPFCKKAKAYLKKKQVPAYYIVVNKLDNKDEVISFINDYSGDDKYPKIYMNGEKLGGLK